MQAVAPVSAGSVTFGTGHPLAFILGPCVIESEAHAIDTALFIADVAKRLATPVVFKASFDKANRTSITSYRGPGLTEGLKVLAKVKARTGLPMLTDVHEVSQIAAAAEVVDILQIPAFLSRQTDLLVAAAKTGRVVNVKKGQFLAPLDTVNIADKMRSFGCERFLITERGTTFGYNNLVVDMRSLYLMRKEGIPVIFDATHSVQRPGGLGGATGGDGELAPVLARAAVATGIDGLFMEVHSDPANALSDGPNQIPLEFIEDLLIKLLAIHHASH